MLKEIKNINQGTGGRGGDVRPARPASMPTAISSSASSRRPSRPSRIPSISPARWTWTAPASRSWSPSRAPRNTRITRRKVCCLTEDWQDYNIMGKPVYRHRNADRRAASAGPPARLPPFLPEAARHLAALTQDNFIPGADQLRQERPPDVQLSRRRLVRGAAVSSWPRRLRRPAPHR